MTSKEKRITEIQERISRYRDHECSDDEWEGWNCSVCVDIRILEGELAHLRNAEGGR